MQYFKYVKTKEGKGRHCERACLLMAESPRRVLSMDKELHASSQ